MAKYCPIMSHQNKWNIDVTCYGKECTWADKKGNCLIAKALKQYTDPLSALAQGYPATNLNSSNLFCTNPLTDKDKENA